MTTETGAGLSRQEGEQLGLKDYNSAAYPRREKTSVIFPKLCGPSPLTRGRRRLLDEESGRGQQRRPKTGCSGDYDRAVP